MKRGTLFTSQEPDSAPLSHVTCVTDFKIPILPLIEMGLLTFWLQYCSLKWCKQHSSWLFIRESQLFNLYSSNSWPKQTPQSTLSTVTGVSFGTGPISLCELKQHSSQDLFLNYCNKTESFHHCQLHITDRVRFTAGMSGAIHHVRGSMAVPSSSEYCSLTEEN